MTKTSMAALRRTGLLALAALFTFSGHRSALSQGSTEIGAYALISEVRITRTVSEYTYRATLTNHGAALAGATATAVSLSPNTTIVDAILTFGPVAAGASVISSDTFSFRHNRLVPFDWANIQWAIVGDPANTPPVADAGPDQTVPVGATVVLDGSGSSDAEGSPLTYAWTMVSQPSGSAAVLTGAATVSPSFAIDVAGDYVVQLIVSDGLLASLPDTVTVSTSNSAPVAHAGPDQTVLVGETVTLDGSSSSDVDGDPLTFAWSFLSRPPTSAAVLSNPTSVNPTFTVDRAGTYVVQLVVHDGDLASVADFVTVTTLNSPPVAHAGPNQSALVGTAVTLDGSASSDVDGDVLTYAWSLTTVPAGSGATLSDPAAVMPTFTIDRPGIYVAQLVVHDGTVASVPDTVTITTLNSPPVADAGPDQSAVVGGLVLLDGTGSFDIDGDPLTYAWALTVVPAGSAATLTGADTSSPSFVVDEPGTYVAQLIVHDGTASSAPDSVTIRTVNSPPTAHAGPDQIGALVGAVVSLSGVLSSDPDGDPLAFAWSFTARPLGSAATLTGADTESPTFTPDLPGDYVVQLIVNDGLVDSAPDTVLIRAHHAPLANAGPDQTVSTGTTVQLDGSGSSDPDGDPIAYLWEFASTPVGSGATLQNPTSVAPTFDADLAGPYLVQLTVTDAFGATAVDSVVITAGGATPLLSIVATDPNATEEGLDTGTFTVTRTGDVTQGLTVSFAVTGTAQEGVDYGAIGASVLLPAGQPSVAVTVTPVDDALAEVPETVIVTLTDGADYDVGLPGSATVTIADNDLPTVTVEATDPAASEEGADPGTLTFTRTGSTTAPLAVVFGVGGTATNGTDYTPALTGGVTIDAGQASATVTVTPVDDAVFEGDETLVATLAANPAYLIGAPATATVTIADDDVPEVTIAATDAAAAEAGPDTGTFTLTRTGPTTAPLLVSYSVGGSATSGTDYEALTGSVTIPAGQATGLVTVTPVDDSVFEGSEDVVLTLTMDPAYTIGASGTATVTIIDSDVPTVTVVAADSDASEVGPDSGAFTLSRSGSTADPLLVTFTMSGSAVEGSDYTSFGASVTIPTGQASATVTVTPENDALVEPLETVILSLVDTDAYDAGSPASATVTITDEPAPVVTIEALDPDASEVGPDPGTFRFARVGDASLPLTVTYAIAGSAENGNDYGFIATVIHFPGGQAFVDLAIVPVNDGLVEGPETVVLTLTDGDHYDLGTSTTATVTIADNPVPLVNLTVPDGSASEVGPDPGGFSLTRTGSTALPLTVFFDKGGSATHLVDYADIGSAVTFLAGQATVDLTISPAADSTPEGTESVIVTLVDDGAYDLGSPSSGSLLIADSSPVLDIVATDPEAGETGPDTGTFTLTRSGGSGDVAAPLLVNFIVSGLASEGSDYLALGTSVTIPAGQASTTLTVVPIADALVEPSEAVIVSLLAGAYTVRLNSAFVTIGDSTEPIVTIVATDPNASEVGLDPGLFTITRTGDTTFSLFVPYEITGSAIHFGDYQGIGSVALFPAGEVSVTVPILPFNDPTVEGPETVILTLVDGAEYDLGVPATATVTIADQPTPVVTIVATDPDASEVGLDPGLFTITRTGDTTFGLVVPYEITGSAIYGGDYQGIGFQVFFSPGETSVTVPILPVNDPTVEEPETVILTLLDGPDYDLGAPTTGTVTITDQPTPVVTIVATDADASEVGLDPGLFTITRTGDTTFGLVVPYEITGSAIYGGDYQGIAFQVFFSPGETSVTVPILPVNDPTVEEPETVILTLLDGPDYDLGAPTTGTVTITDQPTPVVTIVATDPDASEVGLDPGLFTITRTGDTTFGLVVPYEITGSAIYGGDYQGIAFQVFFSPGETSVTVPILPVNDPTVEEPETVILTLLDGPDYDLGAPTTGTVTITDQPTPVVTIVATDPDASEVGLDPGLFTITRTGDTTFGLVVPYEITGSAIYGGDYQGIAFQVFFSPGETSVTVPILPVDDPTVEGPETVILTLLDTADYDLGAATTATVTIEDQS